VALNQGWLAIKGSWKFSFLYLTERNRVRSILSWLCFVDQNLFPHFIFFSITCAFVTGGIMMNRLQM